MRNKDREQQLLQTVVQSGITSPKELANFMAQVSHESHGLNRLDEGFRYTKGPGAIPVPSAHRQGEAALKEAWKEAMNGHPEHLAELMYGMRKDLGNDQAGDGFKYHGRGYIQLTGKANYAAAQKALKESGVDLDLVKHPELASVPENAAKIAVLYWEKRVHTHVNARENVDAATKLVNGGKNGKQERRDLFEHWQKVLTPEVVESIKAGKLGAPVSSTEQGKHASHPHGHQAQHTGTVHAKPAHFIHAPLINEAGHPSHGMYEQIKTQADKLGGAKALGFHSEKEYTQALANMTYQARLSGMTQVDHVVETTSKQNLIMIQGGLMDPAQQREVSNKAQAAQVPVEQSTQQLQQDVQQMQHAQQNAQHQQQVAQSR